jgi:hypothetical protein
MTSTAIFAEILVVGLQATIWLALTALLVADLNGINTSGIRPAITSLKEWAALITVFVIGLAYALGIIIDRLSDSISSFFEKKYFPDKKRRKECMKELEKNGLHVELPLSVGLMRLFVMAKNPEMTKFLEYIRSRMRIARSMSFNLIPITIAAALLARHQNYLWGLIPLAGFLLLLVSIYVSHRISETYYNRLAEAYCIVQPQIDPQKK